MNLYGLFKDDGDEASRGGERVPGTEILLDQADESQRILVPQPSDDPCDPLVSFSRSNIKVHGYSRIIAKARLTKSCTELELFLEGNDNRVGNIHVFRARIWTIGHCADVSGAGKRI